DDVVATGEAAAVLAEAVAQDALDPVTADRTAVDLARHRQAQPRPGFGRGGHDDLIRRRPVPMQRKHGQRHAPAVLEYAVEVGTRANPRGAREAVRGHLEGDGGDGRPSRHYVRPGIPGTGNVVIRRRDACGPWRGDA